jgi:hypothetical protein
MIREVSQMAFGSSYELAGPRILASLDDVLFTRHAGSAAGIRTAWSSANFKDLTAASSP